MRLTKTLRKFLRLLLINATLSLLLNCLVWRLSGRILFFSGGALDIDFYNTLCGTFGIIGLVIALYQIAALRNEKEVIHETKSEVLTQKFKEEALQECNTVYLQMIELQNSINNDLYTKPKVKGYLEMINSAINVLHRMDNQQNSLGSTPIVDCGKCIPLLTEIGTSFSKVLAVAGNIRNVKKHGYNLKMQKIISCLSECETKLK